MEKRTVYTLLMDWGDAEATVEEVEAYLFRGIEGKDVAISLQPHYCFAYVMGIDAFYSEAELEAYRISEAASQIEKHQKSIDKLKQKLVKANRTET